MCAMVSLFSLGIDWSALLIIRFIPMKGDGGMVVSRHDGLDAVRTSVVFG